ncbi:MAG: glycosyltransferase, partial [Acidimicrobiales bacterium]
GASPEGPVTLIDTAPITLARPISDDAGDPLSYSRVVDVPGLRRSELASAAVPRISVLIATYDRPELLAGCLQAFADQTLDPSAFELVVVDDGSPGDATGEVLERFAARLPLVWVRIDHAGRSAAKNLAVQLARGEVVLFFDDDDRPAPDLLDEHLRGHGEHADEAAGILGHTGWAPELTVTPLMHYLTDVDKLLFAYGNLTDGQELDWRGFWEGRLSVKRSLLVRYGLHDQRLAYSIDVELAWRLAPHGVRIVYRASARSWMARGVSFDDFCARIEAKGRAQAQIAALHADEEVRSYAKVDGAAERWSAARPGLDDVVARVRAVEAAGAHGDDDLAELHRSYRAVFDARYARGVCTPSEPRVIRAPMGARTTQHSEGSPQLTVTIPVWSRTPELADMAVRTVELLHETARLETEVIVVDNGSPYERPFAATVHRFDENRGVATAWNTGIGLASAPVVAVLNSDCRVAPGWDEALYEAATTGRRIAFPYTDHGDGLGFRQPDQGGTAGWCFMLTTDLYGEIGPFDERFNPAYGEDTDYWHRAWQLGVELSPVPAARVTHARRTTARTDDHYDWLLQAHRYKYGWKHGVDPLRAPPYYDRPIVEYHCRNLTVTTP